MHDQLLAKIETARLNVKRLQNLCSQSLHFFNFDTEIFLVAMRGTGGTLLQMSLYTVPEVQIGKAMLQDLCTMYRARLAAAEQELGELLLQATQLPAID